MKKLLLILMVSICLGCSSVPIEKEQRASLAEIAQLPNTICWNADLEHAIPKWREEVSRRFNNPVLFISHGWYEIIQTKVGNEIVTRRRWIIQPDPPRKPAAVQDIAEVLSQLYQDRDIVLIVCNELGHNINSERVWYALENVWATPDDAVIISDEKFTDREIERFSGPVGSIWEFRTQ